MNKNNLILAFAKKNDVVVKDATIAVNSILEIISDALVSGDEVTLANFGVFKVRDRKASVGHNPRTNEKIEIAARKVPAFTAYTALKKLVNE